MLPLSSTAKTLAAGFAVALFATSWISLQGFVPGPDPVGNPKLDKLKLLPGFRAEHLFSPSENKRGSWVAMTFDDRGRLITSDQYGFLYRLDLPPVGSDTSARPRLEKLNVPPASDTTKLVSSGKGPDSTASRIGLGYAQGLLWAFNSLYVMVNHKSDSNLDRGSGLYRLQDTNGDDQFDKITLLKAFKGEGEHGPHSIVLSPDRQSLYLVCGNFTDVPAMDAYRLPRVWGEDNLFPAIKDPRGHAVDRMAPGGWVAKTDPEGKTWEFVAGGFRNTYDIAFNRAGDLFAYDSDMEWDFGLPWYKPTRICHVTSGAEFGWRTSATNWSPAFADCLPAALNMGQGSPTAFFSGATSRFPKKYQNALFAFDWSFGIIYAVHPQAQGASYTATAEEFISGAPLPLTDGLIGPDGALYFLTGGRKLESDLYRVTYTGPESVAPDAEMPAPTAEHQLRTRLEQYHAGPVAGAVEAAWPHLGHPDRFVRYAARVAIEHQPVGEWQQRALAETDPVRLTHAMLALARHGDKALQPRMLNALLAVNVSALTEAQHADLLRAVELVFVRMGLPTGADRANAIARLAPRYPAKTDLLNRAYSKLLISLEAPGVVEKTLALLAKPAQDATNPYGAENATASNDLILRNPQYGLDIARLLEKMPPAQQTYYATVLSSAKTGWTPALRDRYFRWFARAFRYQGGRSYIGFIEKARKEALAHVPKAEFKKYDTLSGGGLLSEKGTDLASAYTPKGPGKNWAIDTALAVLDSGLVDRDFDRGKKIYAAILCKTCHTMNGEGGDIGPDLTQLGTRFSNRDILEAIIKPDKVVSDQYASTVFALRNGQSVLGRLVGEDETSYSISQNPFAPNQVRKIPKNEVVSRKYSTVSIMPASLINSLNASELKDFIAYLKSGGNGADKVFKTEKTTPKQGK